MTPQAQPDTMDRVTLGSPQVESSEGPCCLVMSDSANHLFACVLLLSSSSDVLNCWQMYFTVSVISPFRREFHKLPLKADSTSLKNESFLWTLLAGLFTFAYIKQTLQTVLDAFPCAVFFFLPALLNPPTLALSSPPFCFLSIHSASLTASENSC